MTDDDYLQFLLPTCFFKICLYLDDEEEGGNKMALNIYPKNTLSMITIVYKDVSK